LEDAGIKNGEDYFGTIALCTKFCLYSIKLGLIKKQNTVPQSKNDCSVRVEEPAYIGSGMGTNIPYVKFSFKLCTFRYKGHFTVTGNLAYLALGL
jgi:hypothetical protein